MDLDAHLFSSIWTPAISGPTLGGHNRRAVKALRVTMEVLLGAAILTVVGYALWWALWAKAPKGATPPDRWLNVVLGLGAVAAVLAFAGGTYLAARYGRRASISIDANVTELPDHSVLISARPVVNAVGLFRVRFHGTSGAVVRVRNVYAVDPSISPKGLWEGEFRLAPAIFGDDDDQTQQFVESGEALKTTVLFRVPVPEGVIGWMVAVSIKAPTRWMPGSSGAWGDKVFLGRPKPNEAAP